MNMKRFLSWVLAIGILGTGFTGFNALAEQASDENTVTVRNHYSVGENSRRMEKLGRGLNAVTVSGGVYLNWRLLDSEDHRFGSADANVGFAIYRNGKKIATEEKTTNYTDKNGDSNSEYQVAPIIDGVEGEKCAVVTPENQYFDIPLNVPAAVTLEDGKTYSYSPGDASCGDVDGDGDYEIILKWDCNAQDNSNAGVTGNVLLDAYDMETKEFLWRIDLGRNIRGGAHYTQFMVYDLDGDGRAEIACKTAPGSKDSAGEYVTKASSDESIKNLTDEENEVSYVDASSGYITTGPEYYTVFDGDGRAIDTIPYLYSRNSGSGFWGNYSNGKKDTTNRVDRFLGAIAYLDGVHPSVVTWRGYYDRTTAAAYTLEDGRLKLTAKFDTDDINKAYIGQGNHNITVADVDGDGKDEVITGALCLDDDFSILWCSGRGHGDALHIGDYDPTHNGFEYFSVHESGGYTITSSTTSSQGQTADYGMTVYDAATGEELYHQGHTKDTGRGVMANIGSGGYYQITGSGTMQANGNGEFSASNASPGTNFRIFWNGDLYDDILNGTNISAYSNGRISGIFSATDCVQVNGTKANPSLSADLFGDWREEVVYPTSDGTKLRVFTTTTPTSYKIKTLMHDSVYRSGVAAEQTAYNQPPHIGFYMDDELFLGDVDKIEIETYPTKTVYVTGESFDKTGLTVKAYYADGETRNIESYTVSGYDSFVSGEQEITVSYLGKTTTFSVEVQDVTSIEVKAPNQTNYSKGQQLNTKGMVVYGILDDGRKVDITSQCTLSGYDASIIGKQTVTVMYKDYTATFTVNVSGASILSINNTYVTDSTESSSQDIYIGSYSGTYIIEHKVKVNSLPANGNSGKNDTGGFLVKFMPEITGTKNGVGAGWYITGSGTTFNVYWKSDGKNATTIATGLSAETEYTFRYTFNNVGVGESALVNMQIIAPNGREMGTQKGLSLRNMTSSDAHKSLPMTYLQIFNQARANSNASVTFSDARVYNDNTIASVDENKITLNLKTLSCTNIYAAKYDENNQMTDFEKVKVSELGDAIVATVGFKPDKVFLWNDEMYPISVWVKE